MNWLAMRATLAVAALYGFFLIFAQFSFVELLRGAGLGVDAEKMLLGGMAVAGIASGFLTAWRGVSPRVARIALGVAGLVAAVAPLVSNVFGFAGIALMTGVTLGVATVCLSALLPAWCGVAWVGLGTGLGYAMCNVPAVFLHSPSGQAWIAAGFALVGVIAMPSKAEWREQTGGEKVFPWWGVLAIFTALVWMDSAAFFIIQHSGDLKSGTWGETLLWRNAAVHLVLACGAGVWLARGGARSLPGTAWLLLAIAALTVNDESTRGISGWFYPAGVSLYSAALVAWPGWYSGAVGMRVAAWRAAWLFAIAGWFGSANGIGMAESLERVPPVFVAGAGAVVGAVMILSNRGNWRIALAVAGVVLVAWMGGISKGRETSAVVSSAAERGRKVYVSEGCIHCHSRYVRPGSADEQIWGPAPKVEEVMKGEPVIIGNRRQGPDLSNVGARRSEAWLKAHFINPRGLVADSSMPNYAHLFEDCRGADLVRYLKESGVATTAELMAQAAVWIPEANAGTADGKALYVNNCAACHGADGRGGGAMAWNFTRPPANLVTGPFLWTAPGADHALRIARVIKYGAIGTDMPGHEVMTDAQINALTAEVLRLRGEPNFRTRE